MKIDFKTYWSKPYCTYTHLCKCGVNRYWATVQDLVPDKVAILTKWTPGCGISPENVDFRGKGCFEEAKRAAEEWLEPMIKSKLAIL